MRRPTDKRTLLTNLLRGKATRQSLAEHKLQQTRFSMTVCSNGKPGPSDLVDTRLADEDGRKRVTYAEFLKDPHKYGSRCIAVEENP